MAEIDDFGAGERATTDVDEEWREQTPGGWRARLLEQQPGQTELREGDLADRRAGDGAPICTSCSKPDPVYDSAEGHWTCRGCSHIIGNPEMHPSFDQQVALNGARREHKNQLVAEIQKAKQDEIVPKKVKQKRQARKRKREEETEEQELRQMEKAEREKEKANGVKQTVRDRLKRRRLLRIEWRKQKRLEKRIASAQKRVLTSISSIFTSLRTPGGELLDRACALARAYIATLRNKVPGKCDGVAIACVWRSFAENDECIPRELAAQFISNRKTLTTKFNTLERALGLEAISSSKQIQGIIAFVLKPLLQHDNPARLSDEEEKCIHLLAQWIRNAPFLPVQRSLAPLFTALSRAHEISLRRKEKKAAKTAQRVAKKNAAPTKPKPEPEPVAVKMETKEQQQQQEEEKEENKDTLQLLEQEDEIKAVAKSKRPKAPKSHLDQDESMGVVLDRFFRELRLFAAKGKPLEDHRDLYDKRQANLIQQADEGKSLPVVPIPHCQRHPFLEMRHFIVGPVAIYAVLSRRSQSDPTRRGKWAEIVEELSGVGARTLRKYRKILKFVILSIRKVHYFLPPGRL